MGESTTTNYETVWTTALGELEVALSKPSFITWFRNTFIFDVEGTIITIGVPNSFALEWLSNKYRIQILDVLKKLMPEQGLATIQFKIATNKPEERAADVVVLTQTSRPQEPVRTRPSTDDATSEITINPAYTFDAFIVGNHNRLAHAAGLAISSDPGKRHNPLFIYGGVGLGKTHLMHAIGNEIARKHPGKRILYSSCERFANEFIGAIQNKRTEAFKEKYRKVDVLLIDDIQFLSGKEGTQEEFFHTFNTLHQTNRQIVMTSDRMPQAIPELEDRLSSRFVWGMVTDIKSPDLETRAAILGQKCDARGMHLPDDVINLLARHYHNNIRELEGGLNQLLATCELEGTTPTLALVERLLKDRQPARSGSLSVMQVFEMVGGYFHVAIDDLTGPRRNKELVYPRQILMYIMRHELNYSFPKIGRELGKDHTTVMHGVEKIEKELPKNNQLQQEISSLKDQLYNPNGN